MKTQKVTHVPDDFYELLGVALPSSKGNGAAEYAEKKSIMDCIGSPRISTLKRESRYWAYYPKLQEINLFALHYPSMPYDDALKADYIRKIIRKNILKVLSVFSPERKINTECMEYFRNIFSSYSDSIHTELVHCPDSESPEAAFRVSRSTELLSVCFSGKGGEAVYTNPFSCRKRAGYYYLKNDPSSLVHIIDLPDLLTDILLMQSIHHIRSAIQIPIVQNVFEKQLQTYSDAAGMLRKDPDTEVLVSSLISNKPLPCSCLIHDYGYQERVLYRVGLSPQLSKDLSMIFCRVLEIYHDIQYENRLRDDTSRTIATAYMTKKNIPKKILEAMDCTSFKKYFKYVEFDEDIDLDAVKAIEKEFEALNKAYFSSRAFFDVKLRFRKLGKHKASGLYYPVLQTLCVDLRSPSSFIHEYFHMLDDQLGDLSLGRSFQDIVDRYMQDFLENLSRLEPDTQAQLNGTGKYNLQYFFRRAEIFARCGEIYFVRILKVESSLVQPNLKYAYPQSENLDRLIKDYYDDLLQVSLKQPALMETV